MTLVLEALPRRYAVCKVAAQPTPEPTQGLFVYAQTDLERSLVCEEPYIPPDALACERDFRAYRVRGPLDFSLVGSLSRLTAALAEGESSGVAVSTYDTDYLLIRQPNVPAAEAAWRAAGIAVESIQG